MIYFGLLLIDLIELLLLLNFLLMKFQTTIKEIEYILTLLYTSIIPVHTVFPTQFFIHVATPLYLVFCINL